MTMKSSSSKTFLLHTGGLRKLRCSSIHRSKFSAFDPMRSSQVAASDAAQAQSSICGVNSSDRKPSPAILSSRAPRPLGPYPHARRVGNLLFLSGIGPRHRETEQIPEGIEAQTRACIQNVRAILEDAGSSLEK